MQLVKAPNVRTDTLAVDAGLMFMHNGGDFADGVLWHPPLRVWPTLRGSSCSSVRFRKNLVIIFAAFLSRRANCCLLCYQT